MEGTTCFGANVNNVTVGVDNFPVLWILLGLIRDWENLA